MQAENTASETDDTDDGHVDEKVLKEVPHAGTGIDLFHFNLRVDIALTEKVRVHRLYLTNKRPSTHIVTLSFTTTKV